MKLLFYNIYSMGCISEGDCLFYNNYSTSKITYNGNKDNIKSSPLFVKGTGTYGLNYYIDQGNYQGITNDFLYDVAIKGVDCDLLNTVKQDYEFLNENNLKLKKWIVKEGVNDGYPILSDEYLDDEFEEIKDVKVLLDAPSIGTKVKDIKVNLSSDIKNSLITNFELEWYEYNEKTNEWTKIDSDSAFEENKKYKVKTNIPCKADYVFTKDVSVTVNGKNISIYGTDYDYEEELNKYSLLVEYEFDKLEYSYEFLDNTGNINLKTGKIESLSFRIDCDKANFKSIMIGNILLDKEDYELKDGSTIITLTKSGLDKINKLKSGKYNVKITFNEDKVVNGVLNLTEEINNPKTFDPIVKYCLIFVIFTAMLVGCIYIKKKNKKK